MATNDDVYGDEAGTGLGESGLGGGAGDLGGGGALGGDLEPGGPGGGGLAGPDLDAEPADTLSDDPSSDES